MIDKAPILAIPPKVFGDKHFAAEFNKFRMFLLSLADEANKRALGYTGSLRISDSMPTIPGLYKLMEFGTYANLIPAVDASGNPSSITAVDGKINEAYYDGIKWVNSKITLPQANQYIAPFVDSFFPLAGPVQRTYNNSIWQLQPGMTAQSTDVPYDYSYIWRNLSSNKILFFIHPTLAWDFNTGVQDSFDDLLGSENKVKVTPGDRILLSNKHTTVRRRRLVFYTAGNVFVSSLEYDDGNVVTIPDNAGLMAIDVWSYGPDKSTIVRESIEVIPYTGENFFKIHPSLGWNFNNGDQESFDDMLGSANKLKVKPGFRYTLSKRNSSVRRMKIIFFSGSGNYIKSDEYELNDVFIVPNGAGLMAIDVWSYGPDKSTIVRDDVQLIEKSNIYAPKWAAIGDSITAGDETNSLTAISYATLTANRLGLRLQKLGYWGQRMDYLQNAYAALDTDVDVVTVFFGHNDYVTNWDSKTVDAIMNVPYNQLGTSGYQTSFEWLRWFVETMRQNKPQITIIVLTPIIRKGDNYTVSLQKQQEYVSSEIEICKRMGVRCIDIHNSVPIRGDGVYQDTEGSAGDLYWVHPNTLGKRVITNRIVSELNLTEIIK